MSDPRKELKRLAYMRKNLKADKKALITDALQEAMNQISNIESVIAELDKEIVIARKEAQREIFTLLRATPGIKFMGGPVLPFCRLLVGRKRFNIHFNDASMELWRRSQTRHGYDKIWKMTIKPQTIVSQILAIAGEER